MPESALDATYRAIRHVLAWRVVARDGVVVEGPDAPTWLQGQVSQDLDDVTEIGASAETLVLSPQGRIDSYCRVTKLSDDAPRYLLDLKAGAGANLYERLRRFRLRVKATVEMLDRLHVLEQRGPDCRRIAGSPVVELAAALGGVAELAVSWPGLKGWDWLFTGDPSGMAALAHILGLTEEDGDAAGIAEAFEAARVEAGAPELGRELTERTIPQEAGELVARTVSFTKGCYTGQELVARIDARGSNTPRRLRGVVLAARPPAGGLHLDGSPVRQGEAQVGEVTSSAWSPGLEAVVALAYLKRGVDVPSEVTVEIGTTRESSEPETVRGEVRELPMVSLLPAGDRS